MAFNLIAGVLTNDGVMLYTSFGGQFHQSGGILTGTGYLDPLMPILINSGAKVQPGDNEIGTFTFGGDVSFDGELDIEIASASSFDLLKVIGNIDFGPDSLIKFFFEGGFAR